MKVDDEMKQCLNEIVGWNCLLTLSEINRALRRRLPAKPLVHDRTVGKALDGMLIRIELELVKGPTDKSSVNAEEM